MTKFSGTVKSETLENGSIRYSMAVQNFAKKGSTEQPEVTWIDLRFANKELGTKLAEKFAKVTSDGKEKFPHITITDGQLLTENFIGKQGQKISKTVLKVFKDENVQRTVFQKGVNSSFNLVENVYGRILDDFEKVGTDIMKGRIAINHAKYTDKDGNDVRPCVYLFVKMFRVSENLQEMLKKGATIKIGRGNFSTNTYKKEGEQNPKSFTELIINEFEVIPKKDVPKTEDTENVISDTNKTINVKTEEPVIEINEDEIPF